MRPDSVRGLRSRRQLRYEANTMSRYQVSSPSSFGICDLTSSHSRPMSRCSPLAILLRPRRGRLKTDSRFRFEGEMSLEQRHTDLGRNEMSCVGDVDTLKYRGPSEVAVVNFLQPRCIKDNFLLHTLSTQTIFRNDPGHC